MKTRPKAQTHKIEIQPVYLRLRLKHKTAKTTAIRIRKPPTPMTTPTMIAVLPGGGESMATIAKKLKKLINNKIETMQQYNSNKEIGRIIFNTRAACEDKI